MIWFLMGLIIWASLLFLCTPLYRKAGYRAQTQAERQAYLDEIDKLTREIKAMPDEADHKRVRKTELERQLLASAGRDFAPDKGPRPLLILTIVVGLGATTLAIYSLMGRPDLTQVSNYEVETVSQRSERVPENNTRLNNMSLAQLVEQLEMRLKSNPDNAEGWQLYARSLMNLGRYEEALQAYEKVLGLTHRTPAVVSEYNTARRFVELRQGTVQGNSPNAEDIAAIANMAPEDRQVMIEAMVEGLAARLADNPDDPEGWIRLFQSRQVLGQTEKAQADIDRMKDHFSDAPETVERILRESGWN